MLIGFCKDVPKVFVKEQGEQKWMYYSRVTKSECITARWPKVQVIMSGEMQATIELSLQFHNFYNVDLFQRG